MCKMIQIKLVPMALMTMSKNQVASTSSEPNDQESARSQVPILQPTNIVRDHPLDTIIGDISRGVQTRSILVLVYFKHTQINSQAHGYHCSFHPGVFQYPQGNNG